MNCAYPQCTGTLHLQDSFGYCPTCRNSVVPCVKCQAQNRSTATFCTQCGERLSATAAPSSAQQIDAALATEPMRTRIKDNELISTSPQAAYGMLWALSEQGNLYCVNPCGDAERHVQIRTRFWAKATVHAFALRELRRAADTQLTEVHAVVATPTRIDAWGLVTQKMITIPLPSEGDSILCNARDLYQCVEASETKAYFLVRNDGQTFLMQTDLFAGPSQRLAIGEPGESICGPIRIGETVVAWSANAVWTLRDGGLVRDAAPSGISLWTSPSEDGKLRLPLGCRPATIRGDRFYLPASQHGSPALLSAQARPSHWKFTVIPVGFDGTMSADAYGSPLLSSRGHLSRCVTDSFQDVVRDDQISGQLACFNDGPLSVYFCQSDYGGLQQLWMKARNGNGERPVAWQMQQGYSLKECYGFWSSGGALTTQLLMDGRNARTEFVSWRV